MLVEKIQILRRVLHLPAVKHCCIEDPPAGSGRIHIFGERQNGCGAENRKTNLFCHQSAPNAPEHIAIEEIKEQTASGLLIFRHIPEYRMGTGPVTAKKLRQLTAKSEAKRS